MEEKVGLYLRLSRDDEREGESMSIENQRKFLTQYAQNRQWAVRMVYSDESIILGTGQEVTEPQGFPGLVLIFSQP